VFVILLSSAVHTSHIHEDVLSFDKIAVIFSVESKL